MKNAAYNCAVYLHPAAASNPLVILKIQKRTGLQAIVKNSLIILQGAMA